MRKTSKNGKLVSNTGLSVGIIGKPVGRHGTKTPPKLMFFDFFVKFLLNRVNNTYI
jgi:hypothetical protein